MLFDGEKRQVFAARDSSGGEPLHYCLDEDGAVSLSNSTPLVPTDDGAVQARPGRRASAASCTGCGLRRPACADWAALPLAEGCCFTCS